MWFLKGRPTNIVIDAAVESVTGGYQRTSYRFTIDAEEETTVEGKVWIALSIPWAPHKENGGITFMDNDFLNKVNPVDGVTTITKDDVKVWERLRSIKVEKNIDLVNVQELITWHLDDIAAATFWAQTGQTYQITYQHKIASDSCLFVPTRLPTIISAHQPKVKFNLWIVDSLLHEIPKQVNKESTTILDGRSVTFATFNDWDWGEDTRFHTDNWESSDDDWSDNDDEYDHGRLEF